MFNIVNKNYSNFLPFVCDSNLDETVFTSSSRYYVILIQITIILIHNIFYYNFCRFFFIDNEFNVNISSILILLLFVTVHYLYKFKNCWYADYFLCLCSIFTRDANYIKHNEIYEAKLGSLYPYFITTTPRNLQVSLKKKKFFFRNHRIVLHVAKRQQLYDNYISKQQK